MASMTATVAGSAAAGAGAALVAQLGLEPQAMFWAFIGAGLGATFAKEAPKFRAALVFSCVVFASSLFGAYASLRWGDGTQIEKNAIACTVALFFHPAVTAIVEALPSLLSGLASRLGIGSK
jgi:hypothetical protein